MRESSSIIITLMRELRNNNAITYEKLSSKINYWCGEGTIRKWVQSRDGYKVYEEGDPPSQQTPTPEAL